MDPLRQIPPKQKPERDRQKERERERFGPKKLQSIYPTCSLSIYLYPLVVSFPSLLINRETAGVIFQVKEESSGQNLYMT